MNRFRRIPSSSDAAARLAPAAGPNWIRRATCSCKTAGILLVATGAFIGGIWWHSSPSAGQLSMEGRRSLIQRDYARALQFARRALSRDPNSKPALLVAGESAAELNRFSEALEYYRRIPDDGSPEAVKARCAAGERLLFDVKRLPEAERQFLRALQQDHQSRMANDRMAYLLAVGTRNWAAIPYRLESIRLGQIDPRQLWLLAIGDAVLHEASVLQHYHDANPDDPAVLTALARVVLKEKDYSRAEQLLRNAVRIHRGLAEAQYLLGRVLLETQSDKALFDWYTQLPKSVHDHPELWAVLGDLAREREEIQVSARCFWEAVRRDPNHQQANYQLGQALIMLEETAPAETFLERSRLLADYSISVKLAYTTNQTRRMREASEKAEEIGLLWEAYAWAQLCLLENRQSTGSRSQAGAWERVSRLEERLQTLPLTRTVAGKNPALRIDPSPYPLPAWSGDSATAARPRPPVRKLVQVTFADQATTVGLTFRYFMGADPHEPHPRKMYETGGGGVAVLDYDGDVWPDIYFTQGCRWPPQEEQQDHVDRLFRNLDGHRFEDVTARAGLAENRFSQGATVGDFNSDGFPDLYVANIGPNRLYQNNGDGTFTDVTKRSWTGAALWTTSCVMADLNGDAHPDLYAVNYLAGKDVFTRTCQSDSSRATLCLPRLFPAAQDQLYLNLGDGRFEEVKTPAGIEVGGGRGLGVVAADFEGSGRLSLFVANDGDPNFYFVNQTPRRGVALQFADWALTQGLALDGSGNAEACMGVAAGDADGDGSLDLFVTNFEKESNTLYLNNVSGVFRDATAGAALRDASIPRLGFGTQFLDADLDGSLDLIVTNGHIDHGLPGASMYAMPPQFFHNGGQGRFAEMEPESLGPYFSGQYLGRGLARLDWNRDGRDDVVITHLDAPAALLTNTTEAAGHFLAVRLRGVVSDRDAIGTTVTLRLAKRTLVRQLTAGDGYQASNERRLVFGLGEKGHVEKMHVRWPSGAEQTLSDVPCDVELIFIEGRARPITLSQPAKSNHD